MADSRRVVHALVARGLLPRAAALDGSIRIVESFRRNRHVRVVARSGRSYFVKCGIDAESTATVAHEADVYAFLDAKVDALRAYLPRWYGYDSRLRALILEDVRGACDLRAHVVQHGAIPVSIAAQAGRALAQLHRAGARHSSRAPALGTGAPWILHMTEPSARMLADASGGDLDLIRVLQASDALCAAFGELRAAWRATTLVHFDFKWDNCLVAARGSRLKIVDWELAAPGDPAWDVGCALADYLTAWVFSIPVERGASVERLAARARSPLRPLRASVAAFWTAYRDAIGTEPSVPMRLDTVMRFAAARLVQAAFEQLALSTELSAQSVLCLQLSLNIVRRPRKAAVDLLGLRGA